MCACVWEHGYDTAVKHSVRKIHNFSGAAFGELILEPNLNVNCRQLSPILVHYLRLTLSVYWTLGKLFNNSNRLGIIGVISLVSMPFASSPASSLSPTPSIVDRVEYFSPLRGGTQQIDLVTKYQRAIKMFYKISQVPFWRWTNKGQVCMAWKQRQFLRRDGYWLMLAHCRFWWMVTFVSGTFLRHLK